MSSSPGNGDTVSGLDWLRAFCPAGYAPTPNPSPAPGTSGRAASQPPGASNTTADNGPLPLQGEHLRGLASFNGVSSFLVGMFGATDGAPASPAFPSKSSKRSSGSSAATGRKADPQPAGSQAPSLTELTPVAAPVPIAIPVPALLAEMAGIQLPAGSLGIEDLGTDVCEPAKPGAPASAGLGESTLGQSTPGQSIPGQSTGGVTSHSGVTASAARAIPAILQSIAHSTSLPGSAAPLQPGRIAEGEEHPQAPGLTGPRVALPAEPDVESFSLTMASTAPAFTAESSLLAASSFVAVSADSRSPLADAAASPTTLDPPSEPRLPGSRRSTSSQNASQFREGIDSVIAEAVDATTGGPGDHPDVSSENGTAPQTAGFFTHRVPPSQGSSQNTQKQDEALSGAGRSQDSRPATGSGNTIAIAPLSSGNIPTGRDLPSLKDGPPPPAPPAAAAPQLPQSTTPTQISLQLEPDANGTRIQLAIRERGGEVQVTVRANDAELAGSLRQNLPELVRRLDSAHNTFSSPFEPALPMQPSAEPASSARGESLPMKNAANQATAVAAGELPSQNSSQQGGGAGHSTPGDRQQGHSHQQQPSHQQGSPRQRQQRPASDWSPETVNKESLGDNFEAIRVRAFTQ